MKKEHCLVVLKSTSSVEPKRVSSKALCGKRRLFDLSSKNTPQVSVRR